MRPEDAPDDRLRARVAKVLGSRVESGRKVVGGYTPANRWVLRLADGRSVFAKTGANAGSSLIATWLRVEYRAYADVAGAFMPAFLGWDDDGVEPLLLLEDLSLAYWPPPWSSSSIAAVQSTLNLVANSPVPAWADDMETRERGHLSGWARVQEDRRPFLAMGLYSERWLTHNLAALFRAGASAVLTGDALVHFDVRSDNLCFLESSRGMTAKLIDWNYVGRGNAEIDRVFWLSSLAREGGPRPETLVPDSHGLSALLSGYFAAQAGLPSIPTAPGVRVLQREQLLVVLPWAVQELDLEPLDGAEFLGSLTEV